MIVVFVWAIAGNVFYYSFKAVLRREGYQTSFFFGFLGDIPDFLELIRKQSDPAKKRIYQKLFIGLLVTAGLFPVLVLIMSFIGL